MAIGAGVDADVPSETKPRKPRWQRGARHRLLGTLWKFFNSRWALGCSLAILAIPFFLRPMFPNRFSRVGDFFDRYGQFSFGIWQSIIAGLFMAWIAFISRVKIREFFQPQMTYVRAPLMLSVAPLIMAKTERIWEKHGLNMDLDFRYAGRGALDDMKRGRCVLSVASDVAICFFLKNHTRHNLRVIPFVRIVDHLKVIFRKGSILDEDPKQCLAGKKIGYYPDSVHADFMRWLNLGDGDLVEKGNVVACYHALTVSREIDAFILWEPHYCAFTKFPDISILQHDVCPNYEWFLCLVANGDYVSGNREIARRILSALRDACNYCESHRHTVVKECAPFSLSEFTGITEEELENLLKKDGPQFGVDENIEEFLKRVTELGDKNPKISYGAGVLMRSLWPSLE